MDAGSDVARIGLGIESIPYAIVVRSSFKPSPKRRGRQSGAPETAGGTDSAIFAVVQVFKAKPRTCLGRPPTPLRTPPPLR